MLHLWRKLQNLKQMKTIIKIASVAASVVVSMVSCVKEQTGFSIEDIPGTAKVMGVITINEGQAYENGKFIDLNRPAANMEIVVKVANDGLSPNAAQGYTDFIVTTDDKGYYEQIIPATEKLLEVVVLAPSFLGTYNELQSDFGFDGDEPVFAHKEVMYTFEKKDYVSAGRVLLISGEYDRKDLSAGYEKSQELVFSVLVQAPSVKNYAKELLEDEVVNPYDVNYYAATFKPLSNVQLEITMTGDFNGDTYPETQVMSGVTGSDGYADIVFYAHSLNLSDVQVEVKARETNSAGTFNFYTWSLKESTGIDSGFLNPTYKWSQDKSYIPAEYYYYRAHESFVGSVLNFGGLRVPNIKIDMELAIYHDDVPQAEKDDEEGWYSKWQSVSDMYYSIWFE